MEIVPTFADLIDLFERHAVRYLIIGGVAFIRYVKPRYTKDIDIWIDPLPENVERANLALKEFGSPDLLDKDSTSEILLVGVVPSRIDILREINGNDFDAAWEKRDRGNYGATDANWVDIETLLEIKSGIDDPRHQQDAKDLRAVLKMRKTKSQE